jgi:hypothetical protein
MWGPRRLTALWASTACYMDSFTFLPWGIPTYTSPTFQKVDLEQVQTSRLTLSNGPSRNLSIPYQAGYSSGNPLDPYLGVTGFESLAGILGVLTGRSKYWDRKPIGWQALPPDTCPIQHSSILPSDDIQVQSGYRQSRTIARFKHKPWWQVSFLLDTDLPLSFCRYYTGWFTRRPRINNYKSGNNLRMKTKLGTCGDNWTTEELKFIFLERQPETVLHVRNYCSQHDRLKAGARVVHWKSTDVSEVLFASIFRVE